MLYFIIGCARSFLLLGYLALVYFANGVIKHISIIIHDTLINLITSHETDFLEALYCLSSLVRVVYFVRFWLKVGQPKVIAKRVFVCETYLFYLAVFVFEKVHCIGNVVSRCIFRLRMGFYRWSDFCFICCRS